MPAAEATATVLEKIGRDRLLYGLLSRERQAAATGDEVNPGRRPVLPVAGHGHGGLAGEGVCADEIQLGGAARAEPSPCGHAGKMWLGRAWEVERERPCLL